MVKDILLSSLAVGLISLAMYILHLIGKGKQKELAMRKAKEETEWKINEAQNNRSYYRD